MPQSLENSSPQKPPRPLDILIAQIPKKEEARRSRLRLILGGQGAANSLRTRRTIDDKPVLPEWKKAENIRDKLVFLRDKDRKMAEGTEEEREELRLLIERINTILESKDEEVIESPTKAVARIVTEKMKKSHVLYLEELTKAQKKFVKQEAGYWDIEGIKPSPLVIKAVFQMIEFISNLPEATKKELFLVNFTDSTLSHMAASGIIAGHLAEMKNEKEGRMVVDPEHVTLAAAGHDMGKGHSTIDPMVRKPGNLTDSQYECMKLHADVGEGCWKIVLKSPGVPESIKKAAKTIIAVAKSHHERPDGKGYPNGLTSEEIPLEVKIAAGGDVAQTMSIGRSYDKRKFNDRHKDLVIKTFKTDGGKQFDKGVANLFLKSGIRVVDHRTHVRKKI